MNGIFLDAPSCRRNDDTTLFELLCGFKDVFIPVSLLLDLFSLNFLFLIILFTCLLLFWNCVLGLPDVARADEDADSADATKL